MSGPTKIGKSTLLEKIYLGLKDDYSIGGIITLGQKKRKFVDLSTGEERAFSENKNESGITIGDFLISNKSIEFASEAILKSREKDIIIIDEIGILESERKCLYEPIRELLNSIKNTEQKCLLLCVREYVLPQILAAYDLKIDDLWRISNQPDEEILNRLKKYIKNVLF